MIERTFDTPAPVDLYVENRSGHVRINAVSTERTEVTVRGRDAGEVEITHDGGHVRVLAPRRHGLVADHDLTMDIEVPSKSSVVVRSGSADVHGTGALGAASVKSGSGAVTLEAIAGDASLDTGSGAVEIGRVDGDLRVRSGSGGVMIRHLCAAATISTGSGDVTLEHAEGSVVVKTGSGDLDVAHAESDVTMTTGSGDTTVRYIARGRVTSKGASGDIRVGIPSGTAVWTDISTLTGSVRSGLPQVGEPDPGADHVEVRASTVSGDVHLVQA